MVQLTEAAWKPVTRGGSRGGYSIGAYAASSSWYNNYIDNSGSRLNRLRRYNDADRCSVEISRALDILAEDISSSNADDEPTFQIEYPDDVKINKTTLKLYENGLKVWGERTGFEQSLFERVRDTLKYGATFFLIRGDGSLKRLPTERFVGYIVSQDNEDEVTHYVYDPHGDLICNCGTIAAINHKNAYAGRDYESIPVSSLVVLKTTDAPFGESIIEKVYATWRKMSLLEDSVVIYRVTRSAEKRIFYIDTGNLQGPKREAAMERQRLRLMQKQVLKNGQISTEFDPHSASEDIFIPTNSAGKGSRVEVLPGGQQTGETGDLEWFAKKLAAGLRIPYSMIDTQGDQQQQFTDMRVGQMYQIEMRYLGYVKRFQRRFGAVLCENFREFCDRLDIVFPDYASIYITSPMSFSIYKEMELNQTMLNVYNGTLQVSGLSKKYAFIRYLNFEPDELRLNEESKLMEMGIDIETIKTMPQSDIDNLVYGVPKASIATKYGIDTDQQGAAGGRW